ncbi:MAG: TlpA disulfide reductase family protein [Nitrospirota bacterium]|nr:TlpA disulfide reductase family protein [Nitrospirota bacterium]
MKKILLLSLFVISAMLVIFNEKQNQPEQAVSEGLYAPDFEVSDTSAGDKVSLPELKGKVIFLHFWASWCDSCKGEMPSIEALYRKMTDNDNFRMITVIYKDDTESAVKFMSANGYSFPVYSDPKGKASKNYRVTGVPETFIIDKKGIIKRRAIGADEWSSPANNRFIGNLLSE